MTDDEQTPFDELVDTMADLFVYAPIGLFFEGPTLLPKLAEQGRTTVRNARMFGQFAVRMGETQLRRRLSGVEAQAEGWLRSFGLVTDDDAATRAAARAPGRATPDDDDGVVVGFERPGTTPAVEPAGPVAGDLAITDYDSLSASQVVTRLEGLTADELEAVRAYEAAHRGRKTILNKAAQLAG